MQVSSSGRSFISPFWAERRLAREHIEASEFVEVHVDKAPAVADPRATARVFADPRATARVFYKGSSPRLG
jgi:adenylylsulfate kinase-like enzyme